MFLDDPLLPRASAPPSNEPLSKLKKSVLGVAALQIVGAIALFSWALRNSLVPSMGFDWGIANFAVTFIAGVAALIAGSANRRSHTVVAATAQILATSMNSLIYGQANGFSWALNMPQTAKLLVPCAMWTAATLLQTALLVASTVDDDTQARTAVPELKAAKVSVALSLVTFSCAAGFWIVGLAVSFQSSQLDWASCAFIMPMVAALVGVFAAFDSRAKLALANVVLLVGALVTVATFYLWPIVTNAMASAPLPLDTTSLVQLIAWAVLLLVNVGVAWLLHLKLRPSKRLTRFTEL
jgi:hypothetical protein